MSAPFDPSKLNLDIDAEENVQTPIDENTTLSLDVDILSDTNIPNSQDIDKNTQANTELVSDTISPAEKIVDPLAIDPIKTESVEGVIPTENVKSSEDAITVEPTKEVSQEEIKNDETSSNEGAAIEAVVTQKIIDINLASLEDIITIVDEKKYDYVIIEPEDVSVKVTFKQDNIDREVKYIKFPVYTNILFKTKQITGLTVEDTGSPQEGKGSIKIGTKTFKLASKTAPGQNGEKIWLKSKEDTSAKNKKVVKKTPLSTIFAFLGAILFVALVLGSAFIAFIVLNANEVEDVQFFVNLGIDFNQINTFISQVVTLIFSILLLISSIALSISLFKFFLTKKSLKRKKVIYGMLSTIMLIITFSVGIAWMTIDQKIKSLPNWQEKIYGNLKIFDNSLLINEDFDTNQALMQDTKDLIGPITLQFDLNNFQSSQADKGIAINKYIWEFGSESIETFSPTITKEFTEKGNFETKITAIGIDSQGEEVSQEITNTPAVSVSHVIEVQETLTSNGGKQLEFDASDLENLGKVQWYFYEPESNTERTYTQWEEIAEGYEFFPRKIFFEEVFVGIAIIDGNTVDPEINKVIVISPDGETEIGGEISFEQSLSQELDFTFSVINPSTGFANGFIENYQWKIEDKTYSSNAEIGNTESSPKIEHTFENYGLQEISVTLTDTTGKSTTLTQEINIQKKVELRSNLIIEDEDGEDIEELRYEEKSNEYYIDGLGIPATLTLDARLVRPENILYSLRDVSWDLDNNGNIDGTGKNFDFPIPTEGNHKVAVNYTFEHRKDSDDTITLTEYVYVEGIKKEAILDLKIEYDSNYAPVNVRFDASKSFIKNDDIVKFIYDYGDGITEERDSINPGHKYDTAGDYTVTLTVIGKTGKTYSLSKKLILLPPAQEVQITTSLKKAPVGQGIDFSSAESAGQIVEYFWKFGDGNISTGANPTHSYSKAGTYTVELIAEFSNKNSISDQVEITIVEEEE